LVQGRGEAIGGGNMLGIYRGERVLTFQGRAMTAAEALQAIRRDIFSNGDATYHVIDFGSGKVASVAPEEVCPPNQQGTQFVDRILDGFEGAAQSIEAMETENEEDEEDKESENNRHGQ
jgi:hypothetical protein